MATLAKETEATTSKAGKPGRKRNPFDFTLTKQKFREPRIFGEFVAEYPDHSATVAYFYRLKPVIDVTLIGDTETSIGKAHTIADMSESYVAEHWGRGLYWVCFNDENRPKGQQQIAQTWFDINDPQVKAPVYDVRTLVLSNRDNIDEVNRCINQGTLVRDAQGRPCLPDSSHAAATPAPAPVAPAAPAPPQSQLMANLGEQVLVKLLDRALPSAALSSPSDTLDQAFKIADRLNPTSSKGDQALDMDVLAEKVAARLKPAAGPVSSLETELQTYERIGGLLDRAGAGRALDAAGKAVANVVDAEPAWMRPVMALLEPAAKQLVPLMIARFSGPAAPATQPPGRLPPGTASSVSSAPPAASYPVFLTAEAPLMDRAIQVVSLGLQKFEQGVSGFDFAAWMCGFYPGGREVFTTLEQAGGPAECIGLMSMFPQLQELAAPVLADPARKQALEEWLVDFLDYDPDAGSVVIEESADDAEPAAA